MGDRFIKESILHTKYGYLISDSSMLPVRVNQAMEEIKEKERMLGNEIYFQRDRER